ncbi:hypothetical protein D3C81_2155440 [compost metagenome]
MPELALHYAGSFLTFPSGHLRVSTRARCLVLLNQFACFGALPVRVNDHFFGLDQFV